MEVIGRAAAACKSDYKAAWNDREAAKAAVQVTWQQDITVIYECFFWPYCMSCGILVPQ